MHPHCALCLINEGFTPHSLLGKFTPCWVVGKILVAVLKCGAALSYHHSDREPKHAELPIIQGGKWRASDPGNGQQSQQAGRHEAEPQSHSVISQLISWRLSWIVRSEMVIIRHVMVIYYRNM